MSVPAGVADAKVDAECSLDGRRTSAQTVANAPQVGSASVTRSREDACSQSDVEDVSEEDSRMSTTERLAGEEEGLALRRTERGRDEESRGGAEWVGV